MRRIAWGITTGVSAWFVVAWLVVAVQPSEANAKCALCARNAAAAIEATGGLGALVLAALVLLVPSIAIFAGVSMWLWKQR